MTATNQEVGQKCSSSKTSKASQVHVFFELLLHTESQGNIMNMEVLPVYTLPYTWAHRHQRLARVSLMDRAEREDGIPTTQKAWVVLHTGLPGVHLCSDYPEKNICIKSEQAVKEGDSDPHDTILQDSSNWGEMCARWRELKDLQYIRGSTPDTNSKLYCTANRKWQTGTNNINYVMKIIT